MGEIAAANIILALLLPGHEAGKDGATAEKRKSESQKELLDEIDSTGLEEWSQNKQKEDQEFITEYACIFAE